MPSLQRSLLTAATAILLAGAATACGDDSDSSAGSGGLATSLSDVEFTGNDPMAWPWPAVCDESLLLSPSPLAGQRDAGIFDAASGDGHQVDVTLPEGSELEPGADWVTSVECVPADGRAVVLAKYGPLFEEEGLGVAYAGFDLNGKQLWVHEFSDQTRENIAHGVVTFETGGVSDEQVETIFVHPVSGEVTKTVEGPHSEGPEPINAERYIGLDGLIDMSDQVVNPDVPSYDAWQFDAGNRILTDGLDLAAYDATSGERLWTSDVPDPFSEPKYDASLDTLLWQDADDVVRGVDAETGEELWSYDPDRELTGDVFHVGSGIAIVGSPTIDEDYLVLDTKTGMPVGVPSGLTVLSAGASGIAVVENGELRVVDRAELA